MTNLKHIEINIGKACNNKCRFCMSQKADKENLKLVDFEYLKQKIIIYSKRGYNSIGFLGGDVSIYPKLNEIMIICKENGFENINLITNGMLFSNYEFAKKIVSSGNIRINISIHSHIAEIEDFLTQIPGGFNRKIKAIENFNLLLKDGFLKNPLSINIVLNKQNYKDIIETCVFFYKMGISDIRINFLWPNKDSIDYYDDILITYTEVLPYIKKLILLSFKMQLRITFDSIPPCIFKKIDQKNYKNLIKIFLGEDFDYINGIDDFNNKTDEININFNWKQKKKNELKVAVEQCEKCIYFEKCEGIRKEYVEIFGSEEFIGII